MSAYGALAAWYDALTRDVDYAAFADFYEQCFQQGRGACRTLLDFCCGTGTLTRLMAARGYEMIATDGSPDMLMQAQAHNADLPADAVLYYNPNGGQYYHADQNCSSIKNRFLPLEGSMTYAELDDPAYGALTPCKHCNPPTLRMSEIDQINAQNGYW